MTITSILQSSWYSEKCTGPPVVMMQYSDIRSDWSLGYTNYRNDNEHQVCGESAIPMNRGCCIDSLNSTNDEYKSISYNFVTGSRNNSIMKSAIGSTYCYIKQANVLAKTKYKEMYILDSGYCYENYYQCQNDTLWIYPPGSSGSCNGTPVKYLLWNSERIATTSMGELLIRSITITQASDSIEWTTYVPTNLLTPQIESIPYYVGVSFTFMALMGTLIVGTFYSYRYSSIYGRFYKGRTMFMLAYMLSQFLWLTWIILDSYFLYTVFPDKKSMQFFQTMQKAWLGIASLMSVFITANILLIFMKKNTIVNQVVFILCLVILHSLLSGALYVPAHLVPELWTRMTALWIIFMYFFDITPPLFVFCSLLKSMPKPRSARDLVQLHNYDQFVGLLLVLQIINAIWFSSMIYVTQYTTLLGDDRAYISISGLFSFSFVFHSIVSCVLNHHIRYMLSLGAELETIKPSRGFHKGIKLPLLKTANLPKSGFGFTPTSETILLPKSAITPSNSSEIESVHSDSQSRTFSFYPNTKSPFRESHQTVSYPNTKFGNSSSYSPKLSSDETFCNSHDTLKMARTRDDPLRPFRPNTEVNSDSLSATQIDSNLSSKQFEESNSTSSAKFKPQNQLRIQTNNTILHYPDRLSPALSPLQRYISMKRPKSTYSLLFEANKELKG